MNRSRLLIAVISFLFFAPTNAKTQSVDSILNLYGDKFLNEKIHLHFDKSAYSAGDTIWFKTYLMQGAEASVLSRNVYVDWFDGKSNLLAHQVYPSYGGSAKGQFEVPASYGSPQLHVRVYTKWMLNFDSSFLYERNIAVLSKQARQQPQISSRTILNFFPEGGDLVAGLGSRIAFLATDEFGNGVQIRGALKNSKHIFIDSLKTEYDGMGSFVAENLHLSEKYMISWIDESGRSGESYLPELKKEGVSAICQSLPDKIRMSIERSAEEGSKNTYYLLAHLNEQVYKKLKIDLREKKQTVFELQTADIPTGILQLTVFNEQWQPVAERIIFVNHNDYSFAAQVNSVHADTTRRAKNIFEIEVKDSLLTNMSVSVTDGGLSEIKDNIISDFLLKDELKGKIAEPYFYFSNNSDSTKHFLDLVMLTHGWRRLNWQDIANAKLPAIKFPADTAFLEVSGKLLTKTTGKESVTAASLILESKNSFKQMLPFGFRKDGSFAIDNLMFSDSTRIFIKFPVTKVKKTYSYVINSNLVQEVKVSFLSNQDGPVLRVPDLKIHQRELFFIDEQKRIAELEKQTTLKPVTVYSRLLPKTPLDIMNQNYTSGVFVDESKYRADIIDDPIAYTYPDIFRYLEARVAGLMVSTGPQADAVKNRRVPTKSEEFQKPPSETYDIFIRNERPFIFINEVQGSIDQLLAIPMSEIVYVKVFSSPFVGAWGNGNGGAIAVYTRKGNEELSRFSNEEEKQFLIGYTKYKEFYSPNYADSSANSRADSRSTLYWNPYIITDAKNRKIPVEFYNNDYSNKFRVTLEGINAAGKLVHLEQFIQ